MPGILLVGFAPHAGHAVRPGARSWPGPRRPPYHYEMRRSLIAGRSARSPRHALHAPCQVVRLRDFRLIADRLENFSADGLLVCPAEAVLTGEPVLVSLQFPDTGDWFDAEATVARVVHGRRPGEWNRCLGLVFDRLGHDAERALAHQLHRSPPAPPRSRPGRRGYSLSGMARLSALVPAFAF
jgi:hypothetical protein